MSDLRFEVTKQMDYETFLNMIANIPSCIFFKDTELKYRFSSHFWAQLNRQDIIGKTDLDIRKDKENAIIAMDADREIISSKKGCKYVIESVIDGEASYLELIKEPVIGENGEVIGIVGLINDVTEKSIMEKKIVDMSTALKEQCQELETSNEELKDSLKTVEIMNKKQKMFTASMNHELRSPLNGIIGNLEILKADPFLTDEQEKRINNAFVSSQLMLDIVNELLDFAKMEMGGFTIHEESFSVMRVLETVGYTAKTLAASKGLEFVLELDDKAPKYLISDSKRITQIMHNFVSNAIKYTEYGKVKLRVSYEGGKMIISCSDTGQGIAEEAIPTLFDPFVRINEESNAHIQGTGLGLYVVKTLVENMGGEILVTSKLEEGSNFTAIIPAGIATEDQAQETIEKKIDFSKLKALCVDDVKINAMVMEAFLSQLGVSADLAYSAKEGIKKAEEVKYDVIFMDHMMPEMDGVEAFKIIRESSKKNSETPVVMLTGNTDTSYTEYYKELGISGSLAKPVLVDHIKRIITTVVK